jgi:hypothetical protein
MNCFLSRPCRIQRFFITHPGALPMIRTITSTLSLATMLVTGGCMTPPAALDLSLQHPTAQGRYVVTLQPPAVPAAVNQLHSWQVQVASVSGAPVHGAHIAVDGGMPQHGHGLPTKPRVTRELADGSYLIEGMKFSMTGWWEIKLAIDAPQGADRVTFNTVVANPVATR